MTSNTSNAETLSIERHRLFLGGLAFLWPIVLYFGHIIQTCIISSCDSSSFIPRGSLSSYYYTGMRDIFISILIAWGVFLLTYLGYPKDNNPSKLSDFWTTTIGGVGAVGIALFPTKPSANDQDNILSTLSPLSPTIIGVLHYVFVAIFFLSMTYMSIALFTKSGKEWQKKIYKICGIIMAGAFALIMINFLLEYFEIVISSFTLLFLEVIAIYAFAISWIVKSRKLED